ncbi:MAG: GNAT family N-acetyltransferase [Proteobacteria bacterium]|nr:GNAT family N-acetyltransferase [Pseudomonadota bacterium]
MIRRATDDDVAAIVRLAAQLGGAVDGDGMAARLKRVMAMANHAVFVAESDDVPCGFAAAEHRLVLPFGEWVELTALVVDAGARRQHHGSQLVAAVEAWAGRRGVPALRVRSSLSRETAHAFYPALGYDLLKTQHVYAKSLG